MRTKVYGGEGRLYMNGDRPRLELHNKEPHTTIVEARFGVVAVAARGTKALAGRKASKAYIAAIQGVVGAANAISGISTRTTRGRGVTTTAWPRNAPKPLRPLRLFVSLSLRLFGSPP